MSDDSKAASAATEKRGLRLDQLALIGTFGTEANRYALVRHASGRIRTVRRGETIDGRLVVAIDTGEVILSGGSRQDRLTMPGG